MSSSAPDAILGEIVSLAAENGWTGVADFAAQLTEQSGELLLVTTDAHSQVDAFARWLGVGGRRVSVDQVLADSTLGTDPTLGTGSTLGAGPLLAADRVVVAHPCTEPLTATAVAAIRAARARPVGSCLVVLVAADKLGEPAELDHIERNMRHLIIEPGGATDRRPLAAHGFALWSDSATPPAHLVDRLTTDAALVRAFVEADPPAEALATARAAYAYALAQREVTAAGDAGNQRRVDRRLAELAQEAARDGRSLVTARVASLVRTTEGMVADALTSLEQEVQLGLRRFVSDHRGELGSPTVARAAIQRYLAGAVATWQAGPEAELLVAIQRQTGTLAEVFTGVEWDLINSATGGHYPQQALASVDVALRDLAAGLDAPLPWAAASSGGSSPLGSRAVTPYLVLGALGAAIGALVGGPVGFIIGGAAGAAGAAGVGVVVTRLSGGSSPGDERLVRDASAAIRDRIETARQGVPEAIRARVAPLSAAVAREFDEIDRAISVALAEAEPGRGAGAASATAQLAAIGDRLSRRS